MTLYYSTTVTDALWNYDQALIASILTGINEFSFIDGVKDIFVTLSDFIAFIR